MRPLGSSAPNFKNWAHGKPHMTYRALTMPTEDDKIADQRALRGLGVAVREAKVTRARDSRRCSGCFARRRLSLCSVGSPGALEPSS
jgi:hypothetical protein